jgi:hypothetical protein
MRVPRDIDPADLAPALGDGNWRYLRHRQVCRAPMADLVAENNSAVLP